jgi:glycosyltransferase involved in cell wall biosynthesis
MKLALIGYLHNKGGIQTHTHWLATGLSKKNWNVTVFTPAPLRKDRPGLPINACYKIIQYSSLLNVIKLAMVSRVEFDALVIAGTGWKAMMLAWLLKVKGSKVFFEVMSGERNGRFDPRCLIKFVCDSVVFQGKNVGKKFIESFQWDGRSSVIPALPEPLEMTCRLDTQDSSKRSRELMRKLKLVYFGRIVDYKGIGYIIDNWEFFSKECDFIDIWGTGPDLEKYIERVNLLGFAKYIKFKGRYPEGQEYVDLLQCYDLLLLPTWGKEGAPLVLLEAMACGVPFVANGVGGISDYTNRYCEITNGSIAEFKECFTRQVDKLRAGKIDRLDLIAHYTENFGYKNLVEKWDVFLKNNKLDVI